MGTKNKGVKIQRGFIAGVTAVALVAVATGFVLQYINISASSFYNRYNPTNLCQNYGVAQTEVVDSTPTTQELNDFGQGVKAYDIKINEKKGAFRFVVEAHEFKKLFKTMVSINIGLTFKSATGNLSGRTSWGGNNDRVYLLFDDGSRLDYVYNIAPRDQLMEKTFHKVISDYSKGDFNVEFQGKNYDGCIRSIDLSALIDASTVSPSPTASVSAAISATTSATVNTATVNVKPGFQVYSIPWTTKVLDTQAFEDAGMTVWAFNRHGDGKWYTTGSSVQKISHSNAYYIYNPGTVAKKVVVSRSTNQEETDTYIVGGWNLMSNASGSTDRSLAELEFYLNPCPPDVAGTPTCKTVGTKVSLADLFIGDKMTQRAYPVIFVIDDPQSTDPGTAFREIRVTQANRQTVTIPANKQFWVYVWPQ